MTMILQLYHREECHLCEQALALLHGMGLSSSLQMIDIDADVQLGVEFGLRIPLLAKADGRCLDWPFDDAAVRALLA